MPSGMCPAKARHLLQPLHMWDCCHGRIFSHIHTTADNCCWKINLWISGMVLSNSSDNQHSTHWKYFIVDADLLQCVLNTQLVDDSSHSSPNIVGGCILYKNLLLITRPDYVFVLDHSDLCEWRCVGVSASFSVMGWAGWDHPTAAAQLSISI